jgi:ribosomal protein S18 acetylase RimI-like enzyme
VLERSSALERVKRFDRELRERAATRIVAHDFGMAIFCGDLPRVWDLNVAFLDVPLDRGDADALIAEVEGIQTEARLRHRRLLVSDEKTAELLLPRFMERGWTHAWWVFMLHESAPDRPAPPEPAREVERAIARRVEEQALREDEFIRDDDALTQVLSGRDRLSAGTPARFFVGTSGDADVSVCTVYADGGVAQLEDVATLALYRGQGCGRAVVHTALEAARTASPEVVFVVADDGDWPKNMYRRLGFEPIGRALNLVREPAPRVRARQPAASS